MKNRKKLIKRIGAVLCAVVVAVSSFGSVSSYLGATTDETFEFILNNKNEFICFDVPFEYQIPSEYIESYEFYSLWYSPYNENLVLFCSDSPPYMKITEDSQLIYGSIAYDAMFTLTSSSSVSARTSSMYNELYFKTQSRFTTHFKFVCSNYSVYMGVTDNYSDNSILLFDADEDISGGGEKYNSSLGYLQNVHVNHVFEDAPLGENVAEKYTSRWYYDNLSTTGVDLTSGDYMIRYYQERWIVTGYGADDVVKKSDRYLLGDYIVQNGYIQTYSEDIDSTLAGQGYEEPGALDLLWNKFVTTHYYFQIVDAKNNQVGGLLHVYLTDDNGKFGVEHIGETLDNEGNFDEGGYKDFIDEDKVTTDDVEDGFNDLEDGESSVFGDLDGADAFSGVLEQYAEQIGNVTNAVSALFNSLPSWLLGFYGICFVSIIIGIIVNVI